ncbi:hypothetical protein B0O99DRAFT_59530 [Bisporella sp. PMI_857]|nr:hypothetical protein B0O99DRAFT_59530 [Bisporella sp. PMI_857]
MLSSIINPFQSPPPGTAHAEIRLRATSLALQQNKLMKARVYSLLAEAHARGHSLQVENHILHSPKRRNATGNVRMGGDEDLRRSSHESHQSRSSFTIDTPERVRRNVDKIRAMSKNNRFSPCDLDSQRPLASYRKKRRDSQITLDSVSPNHSKYELGTIQAVSGLAEDLQVAYVLVSPLHGWISTLATMGSLAKEKATLTEQEMKLTVDRTLAVFGDDDIFVGVKKLRAWVKKIEGATKAGEKGRFRHREVPGAGHFWHDRQAVRVLREEIDDFVRTLSA